MYKMYVDIYSFIINHREDFLKYLFLPNYHVKTLLEHFLFTILIEYIFLERLITYIKEFIERSVYGGIKKNPQ
jgi:hypothetical protein